MLIDGEHQTDFSNMNNELLSAVRIPIMFTMYKNKFSSCIFTLSSLINHYQLKKLINSILCVIFM